MGKEVQIDYTDEQIALYSLFLHSLAYCVCMSSSYTLVSK